MKGYWQKAIVWKDKTNARSTRTKAALGYSASARKLRIFPEDLKQTEIRTPHDFYLIGQKKIIANVFDSVLFPSCKMLGVLFETYAEYRQGSS